MGRLAILGTGGMGREAAAWLCGAGRGDDLVGFLDAREETWGTEVAGYPVLGGTSWLSSDGADVRVVVAIGSPAQRAAAAANLAEAGSELASVVHPSATIGPRVVIGDGAIICPGVLLSCDVEVGRTAIVNYGAMIGHDGSIGRAAFVAPGVHLAGNVTVGDEAQVGIGASVIQGVEIGTGAVVGAGAVVIDDVAAGSTVVGVPARPVRRRA